VEPTERAKTKCKDWLVDCLDNGWKVGALTRLEALWWEFHDPITGDVLDPSPPPSGDTSQ
jgi:hypothetical protein